MRVNFLKDLESEIIRLLQGFGYTVPTYQQLRQQDKRDEALKNQIQHYDLKNLLLHFFTINFRRIPVIKWNVHISKKLEGCEKIREIVTKLEQGEDINNLLHNKVKELNQARNADPLRSEWGIYHLHFKESGSRDLLFIYFSVSDAYLIDILGHEKPNGSTVTWTNTDLIQIIHDNWPHVIKPFIFKIGAESQVLSVKQRRALRNKAYNTTIIVSDGTEYLPLGGGYSSSKHPTFAVIQSDRLFLSVKNLQSNVEENHEIIKDTLQNLTSCPDIKLVLSDNLELMVVETKTSTLVNLVEEKNASRNKDRFYERIEPQSYPGMNKSVS